MRHGKQFVDEQGQSTGGYASVYAAREIATPAAAQATTRYPAAAAETVKRASARPSITIEEMTDRIYRRYAVN
jgi:hypothetical protein